MRRSIWVVFILLMLAQSTVSAVAACCLDELRSNGPSTQMQMKAVETSDATHATAASEGLKHTCDIGHCHCHHTSVATGESLKIRGGELVSFHRHEQPGGAEKSHIPEGLDRPNWRSA